MAGHYLLLLGYLCHHLVAFMYYDYNKGLPDVFFGMTIFLSPIAVCSGAALACQNIHSIAIRALSVVLQTVVAFALSFYLVLYYAIGVHGDTL